MLKKRILAITAALICMFTLAACGQNISKEAAEKGRTHFDSGEYETAAKAFGVAIDNGNEDEEVKLLYGICLAYYQAGQEFEKGELENARKALDGIDAQYENYGIKEAITTLKNDVELAAATNGKLAEAEALAAASDFAGAAAVIGGIDTAKLAEEQANRVNDIKAKITAAEEAAKAEAERLAAEEAAKAEAERLAAEEAAKKKQEAAKPVAKPNTPVNNAPTINVNVANDAYIFPTDSQLLTVGHLQNISHEAIALIRNEIYARHGQIFTSEKYINYFSSKTWYTPTKEVRWGDLNSIERQNVLLIQQYESGKLR